MPIASRTRWGLYSHESKLLSGTSEFLAIPGCQSTRWGKKKQTNQNWRTLSFKIPYHLLVYLHRERPIDEVWWFVINVPHFDDHTLVVCVYKINKNKKNNQLLNFGGCPNLSGLNTKTTTYYVCLSFLVICNCCMYVLKIYLTQFSKGLFGLYGFM